MMHCKSIFRNPRKLFLAILLILFGVPGLLVVALSVTNWLDMVGDDAITKAHHQIAENYTRPVLLDLSQFGGPHWDYIYVTGGYGPRADLENRVTDPENHNFDRVPFSLEGEDVQAVIFLQGDAICAVEAVAGLTVFTSTTAIGDTHHAHKFSRASATVRVTVNSVIKGGRDRFYWQMVHADDEINAGASFLHANHKLPHNPTGVCGPDYEAAKKNGG